MKFIKNYKDWPMCEQLLALVKNSNGDTVPVWQPERWTGKPELEEARDILRQGYANRHDVFQQFNPSTKEMKNFNFSLPDIPNDDRQSYWWVVKLLPGQMQPMHFDPHLLETKNPKRYTMFLQNWIPGHIFVYNDKYISNYQAGDLFLWDDPMMQHGVVNIGFADRYSLQITTFDT